MGARAWLVASLLVACGDPARIEWHARFADDVLAKEAARVETTIRRGTCESPSETVYAQIVERDAGVDEPPQLEPGHYAFFAEASSARCGVFASACVELDLPSDDDPMLVLAATAAGLDACPDLEGRDGGIDAATDARIDAAIDARRDADDARIDDASDADAELDADADSGSDAGCSVTPYGVIASAVVTVPDGCTRARIRAWGAGGGGGARDRTKPADGGDGGPGGYAEETFGVAAGDMLTVNLGLGGSGGSCDGASIDGGGDGGDGAFAGGNGGAGGGAPTMGMPGQDDGASYTSGAGGDGYGMGRGGGRGGYGGGGGGGGYPQGDGGSGGGGGGGATVVTLGARRLLAAGGGGGGGGADDLTNGAAGGSGCAVGGASSSGPDNAGGGGGGGACFGMTLAVGEGVTPYASTAAMGHARGGAGTNGASCDERRGRDGFVSIEWL